LNPERSFAPPLPEPEPVGVRCGVATSARGAPVDPAPSRSPWRSRRIGREIRSEVDGASGAAAGGTAGAAGSGAGEGVAGLSDAIGLTGSPPALSSPGRGLRKRGYPEL
jgi:hypothetical protein